MDDTKDWLRVWPNSATLFDGEGKALRSFDWNTDSGRHMAEIVGEGARTRRVEVMVTRDATAGAIYSDREGGEIARQVCGLSKDQVRFDAREE